MVNLALAVLAFAAYLVTRFVLDEPSNTVQASRVFLALMPIPFVVALMSRVVVGVRRLDEMQRLIQLQALSIAFGLLVLLLMVLGLLQLAMPLSPDDWSYRHLWPLAFTLYCGALAVSRKRYE